MFIVSPSPKVPPGFRFLPTEEEILTFYLKPAINGEPLPPGSPLMQGEIYGSQSMEPWKLFNKDAKGTFWVLTKLKRKNNKSRIDRLAGCGCWLGQNTKEVKDASGKLLGFDKYFTFSCKNKDNNIAALSGSNYNGNWIMHEFSLAEDKGSNDEYYVLCEIKNRDNTDKVVAKNKKRGILEVVDNEEMLSSVTNMKELCAADDEGITESCPTELEHQQQNHMIQSPCRDFQVWPQGSLSDGEKQVQLDQDSTTTMKELRECNSDLLTDELNLEDILFDHCHEENTIDSNMFQATLDSSSQALQWISEVEADEELNENMISTIWKQREMREMPKLIDFREICSYQWNGGSTLYDNE